MSSFPRAVEEFRDDARCSYDLSTRTWILTDFDDQDNVYKWDDVQCHWKLSESRDLDASFKADMASMGMDSTSLKRKADNKPEPAPKMIPKAKKPKKEAVNTSIFVTGIPLTATFDEIHAFFKKFGIIAENIDTETPKVVMYADEDGAFKGEVLVTYFKEISVTQAITLADESAFGGTGDGNLRITKADMSYKKVKEYKAAADAGDAKQVQKRKRDVEKIKRVTEKMNAKLADWSDDDVGAEPVAQKSVNKFANNVIVRNMFTAAVLEEEKQARKEALAKGETPESSIIDDLPEDIHEMAEQQNWGKILAIDVYDAEPDGVVKIRFDTPEAAEKGVQHIDGRWFDKRQLTAEVQTKRQKFRKALEEEDEMSERWARYGEDLSKSEA